MKTHKILHHAIRQYRHNNNDGLVFGYDKKEVDKVVSSLLAQIDNIKRKKGEI